ncbi:MAG: class II aldolase/adducin family protein [Halieaceae bacterium]|nr:class II aldolase/adducin family protein [Halieaceae bacterium]
MKKYEGLNKEMVQHFAPRPGRRELLPEMSEKAQVALLCRMIFNEGWNEHIAGHITCRDADNNILVNPWELAWDELTASDILTLNEQGEIIDGDWNITPAIGLHLRIHARRPDIKVVIHNHAHWSGIWANAHRIPPVVDQTAAHVPGELPLFDEYGGTFEGDDATDAAVDALGNAGWALLANHGSLVVGKDLRQAHLRVLTLEWRAQRAWYAEAIGGGVVLPDTIVQQVGITDANGFPFQFEAMARRELRADPSILD